MDNIDNKALENKTLDPEALKDVNGGVMMAWDEMWEHVAYQCLYCDLRDKYCRMHLDGMIEQFEANPDGMLDVVCPKGLAVHREPPGGGQ